MGNSYTKIMFMALDNTRINVTSASNVDDFKMKTLWDFANRRGGFSVNDANPKNYLWEGEDGTFVEFDVV